MDKTIDSEALERAVHCYFQNKISEGLDICKSVLSNDLDNEDAIYLYSIGQRKSGNYISALLSAWRVCDRFDKKDLPVKYEYALLNATHEAFRMVSRLCDAGSYKEAYSIARICASIAPSDKRTQHFFSLIEAMADGQFYVDRRIRPMRRAPSGAALIETFNLSDQVRSISFSSILSDNLDGDYSRLIRNSKTGQCRFISNLEDRPWMQIELDNAYPIARIIVYGSDDEVSLRHPADEVCLYASEDGRNFSAVSSFSGGFGGAISATPIDVQCDVMARFIRLEIGRSVSLRIDAVELFSHKEKIVEWQWMGLNADIDTLFGYMHKNCGIFAILTHYLMGIVKFTQEKEKIKTLNFSASHNYFNSEVGEDIYPLLFKKADKDLLDILCDDEVKNFDYHGLYRDIDFRIYNLIIQNFFLPSDNLQLIINQFRERYQFSHEETLLICYRGNDKYTEVKIAEPRMYVEAAKKIIEENPQIRRVMIQTDDAFAREYFIMEFDEMAFYIKEIPVISNPSKAVAHVLSRDVRRKFTLNFTAAIMLAAKSEFVVTHTGNVSFWMTLFRGNGEGLYQFDSAGELVGPY